MKKFSYTTAQLDNTSYIMPYGQAIADHRAAIATNSTGLLLWEAFSSGKSDEELLNLLIDTYEAEEADIPILKTDLTAFINNLSSHGILRDAITPQSGYPCTSIKIGPIGLNLYAPEAFISAYFKPFVYADASIVQDIHILPYAPITHVNGNIITRSEDIIIFETDDCYVYLPTKSQYVYEMHVTKDAKNAYLHADMRVLNDVCLDELFHIIRFAFLMAAQANDLLVVHSASILYKGHALLFSGHSGAGKSTHTKLWIDTFDTPALNGDLNMIGMRDGKAICYGLPWCGTSGICTTDEHPLASITYLFQEPFNEATPIPLHDAILQFVQRSITPSQTEDQYQKTIALATAICKSIHSFYLSCTKDVAAAELMKKTIDEFL